LEAQTCSLEEELKPFRWNSIGSYAGTTSDVLEKLGEPSHTYSHNIGIDCHVL
jgi:hypothetical protein